ncbi:MAG TPA: hypothetical protein VE957_09475 [Terriglobales bacterium]|jgi:hypothetical protein|nr:hypothetical protein [Terriglobales bacterium]
MATKEIKVQRFSVTSSNVFHDVLAAFEAPIGHPDMNSFRKTVAAAKTITSGNCGIGLATAKRFVQEGPASLSLAGQNRNSMRRWTRYKCCLARMP